MTTITNTGTGETWLSTETWASTATWASYSEVASITNAT
jgi:hypothetical protein